MTTEDGRELKRMRRAARSRTGQVATVAMCFVADGMAHYWIEKAVWHAELQEEWTTFVKQHRLTASERARAARTRADAESERLAAELADDPEFRAATKRARRHSI
ncbi:hypothetical protein, partial [Streptomyces sp. NPDC002078]